MRPISLLVAGFAMAASLGAASGPRTVRSDGAADKYFGCLPGYSFQTKDSSGARCFKGGTVQTSNIVCPAGSVKTLDFTADRDVCQGPGNVISVYGCSSGYDPVVRPGPDICQKQNPPHILAPSVMVDL
jgi:hypothetical protein